MYLAAACFSLAPLLRGEVKEERARLKSERL
jgi:hypothetical protein